jgi:peptidoglycan/xylan/chitin deacetylase (PgdA/CDA1 family)
MSTMAGTGLHRLFAPVSRGIGAIVMLHHVRPWVPRGFSPNRLLEITPEFLDRVLRSARTAGFEFVSLDEAIRRIALADGKPFCAVTADDGYRDNIDHALPVLRRHGAPLTLFVATGFAERTATLWWQDLEDAIARLDRIEIDLAGRNTVLPCAEDAAKTAAFATIYRALRSGPEAELRSQVAGLARQAGLDTLATVDRLCLDWNGIVEASRDPLVTIGVHTVTHPMLAKHPEPVVREELGRSRAEIEARIGRPARHLAFPVGDPGSAGVREFAIAAELGFASAVTTRPGMIFPEHAAHLTALPRVSINGHFQRAGDPAVLLSGAPFMLWNRGRRLNVA